MNHKLLGRFVPFIAPCLLIVIWSILAGRIANQIILPDVDRVFRILMNPFDDLISMGSLVGNILVSLVRVLLGYILAASLAIPLGFLMGYYGLAYRFLNSVLSMFRPIPPLTWVPLVMAWLGVTSLATLFGVQSGQTYLYLNNIKFSMLFIIFIGAFYPIVTSTLQGVRSVDPILINSARVLGAKEHQIFLKVLCPAAMPSIITGLRIGLGIAWMCLVSAEMLPGSISGVGYMITHAFTLASTDIVVAGMISIAVVGAILDSAFRMLEQKLFFWKK